MKIFSVAKGEVASIPCFINYNVLGPLSTFLRPDYQGKGRHMSGTLYKSRDVVLEISL